MTAIPVLLAAVAGATVAGALMTRASRQRSIDESLTRRADHRLRLPSYRPRSTPSITPLALASWCDDLASALRRGSTLRSALVDVAPADATIDRHTQPLRHWIDRGGSVASACDEWSDELADSSVHRIGLIATLAAVLAATASLGGNSAAPLDRFAATMRQRASADLERGAQSAQAQMSAKVLTLVPVAVLVLLLTTDAKVRTAVAAPAGAAVVIVGLALNVAGAAWMRRIVTPPGTRS